MTYQEIKAEYEKARKTRNQYPCPQVTYEAAQARMDEMKALMEASPEHVPVAPLTQSQLDAKMAEAGFEAGGNAGELWNKLNPVRGERF